MNFVPERHNGYEWMQLRVSEAPIALKIQTERMGKDGGN
jgi:hypothetical protein